jgi:hypothetical protein
MFRVFLVPFAAILLFTGRTNADTVLGSRLTEFYQVFGKPSYQEHLGRTSEVQWTPPQRQDPALAATGVFAIEIAALAGVVCLVVVRCHRRLSSAETVRVAQRFFGRRYRVADFAADRGNDPERTRYKLTDGDHVEAGPHGIFFRGRRLCQENHYFVIIRNKTYWHSIDVFDQEAAKVHRPTPNH